MDAEKVNYWQSSKTSPDTWLEKSKKAIRSVGGVIEQSVIASDDRMGYEAFAIRFTIGQESYSLRWPVLRSRTGNQGAARRQAATALYHDVKTCVVRAKFLGVQAAFLTWLELPDGSTAADHTGAYLHQHLPKLLVSDTREG